MNMEKELAPVTPSPLRPSLTRRLVEAVSLFLSILLLLRAVATEPYGVPTGSMSPALVGNHKAVDCPRCGYRVVVGHREDRHEGRFAGPAAVVCPNCGHDELDLEHVPVCRGDQLLVNKSVYDWRRPRRWEMAVFRCPIHSGKAYVKRVIGLPGETVQVRGGDVYIDHVLARKSLEECKALRIPVFDNNYCWGTRWETQPPRGPAAMEGKALRLDAREGADEYQWLVYRHWLLDARKGQSLTDEYPYNGGDTGWPAEAVYDFLFECDLEILHGEGFVAFGLQDGVEEVIAELPVGSVKEGVRLVDDLTVMKGHIAEKAYRNAPAVGLAAGKKYHVEFALVDRRATLAIDGRKPFEPADRPGAERRAKVDRPVRLGARGVEIRLHNVRIFRDVHYTEAGQHAVRAPVRLGAREYFVLGDNSANSDDSRFWSDNEGRPLFVPEANFLGKPFLVHLPSRISRWDLLGGHWEFHTIDWGRIRWTR